MALEHEGRGTCEVCGEVPHEEGRMWLLLNRYGVGTMKTRLLGEVQNEEGECVWDTNPDIEVDDTASGHLLCWPDCSIKFIEGKMLESDVSLGVR